MELDDKSLVTVIAGQPGENNHQTDIINAATEMDLLSNCQTEMEGAVIIFDSDPSGGHIVKVVRSADSQSDLIESTELEDPDNFITLHASTVEPKNELIEQEVLNTLNEEAREGSLVDASDPLPIIIEAVSTSQPTPIKTEVISESQSSSIMIETSTARQASPVKDKNIHAANKSTPIEIVPEINTSVSSTITTTTTIENVSTMSTPSTTNDVSIVKDESLLSTETSLKIESVCSIESAPTVTSIPTIVTTPTTAVITPKTTATVETTPATSKPTTESTEAEKNNEEEEEETIATFITSTGQQLALYAVENSDEVFAVALYDESGEPPTNFHFLMKPDVERLIGEGAVKTVKKPVARKNVDSKTTPKKEKEEIKFDKYQAIIPNIDKPDEIQLQKIEEHKPEMTVSPAVVKPKTPTQSPAADPKKAVITKVSKPIVQKAVSPPKKPVVVKQTIPVQQKQVTTAKPMPMKQVIAANQVITTKQQTPQRHLIVTKQTTSTSQLMTKQLTTKTSNVNKCPTPIVKRVIATRPIMSSVPGKQATYIRNVASVKTPIIKQVPSPKNAPFIRQVSSAKGIKTTPKTALIHQGKVVGIISQNVIQRKKESQNITYIIPNKNDSYILAENTQDELESEVEMIEQSTVQYILCDGDAELDSELTFDELQASLKAFNSKCNGNKRIKMRPAWSLNKDVKRVEKVVSAEEVTTVPIVQKKDGVQAVLRTYKSSPKKQRTPNNLLQTHRKIKKEIEDPTYGDINYNFNSSHEILSNTVPRAKPRSRKQQLTVVNRSDSEIIIQPISTISDEEEEPAPLPRRRGRRKKQPTKDPDYNPRTPTKKNKRFSGRSVEIIDIDVDDADRKNDDGKKLTSSDKENDDAVSLDESSSKEQKSTRKKHVLSMQCTHCLRNFRKKRTLEHHLQSCSKSPAYIQKLEEREEEEAKKEKKFKCKQCDQAFSVAVILARHVRTEHSPRKRGRPKVNKEDADEIEESSEDEAREEESDPEILPKKKVRGETKKSAKDNSTPDIELKLDSSGETSAEPPKRRPGRPPKKIINKDSEKKSDKESEKKSDKESEKKSNKESEKKSDKEIESIYVSEDKESNDAKSVNTNEPKRRGRPPKNRTTKDNKRDRSESPESLLRSRKYRNDEDLDLKSIAQIPKKRGRWSEYQTVEEPNKRERQSSAKKEESASEDEKDEEKNEKSEKVTIAETPKRRGRSFKVGFESNDKSEVVELTEDSKTQSKPTEDKIRIVSSTKFDKKDEVEIEKDRISKIKSDLYLVSKNKDEDSKIRILERSFKDIENKDIVVKYEQRSSSRTDESKEDTLASNLEESHKKTEIPKKKDVADTSYSPNLDGNINELPKVTEEPRKRGRPPKNKSLSEPEEKNKEGDDMAKKRGRTAQVESGNKHEESHEHLKKRGRPAKESTVFESDDKNEEKFTDSSNKVKTIIDTEKKVEIVKNEIKKRGPGRPAKEKLLSESEDKSDKTDILEEPKKRGRPARDKGFSESEDKVEEPKKRGRMTRESKLDKEDPIDDFIEELHNKTVDEPKKRPEIQKRPPKDKSLKPELKEQEIKLVKTTSEPKKRGRPARSKEDVVMDVEEKLEEMFASLDQPKRRGRPARISIHEDKAGLTDSKVSNKASEISPQDDNVKEENIVEESGAKKEEDSKNNEILDNEKSEELLVDSGKLKSPSKSSIDVKKEEEALIAEEPKKRGRLPKNLHKDNHADESKKCKVSKIETGKEETPESTEKTQVKDDASDSGSPDHQEIQSSNSTKFSCEECTDIFTSETELNSHQLSHRTKKSGTLVYHCATCKKLVPAEAFPRHLSSHKRNAPLRSLRSCQ